MERLPWSKIRGVGRPAASRKTTRNVLDLRTKELVGCAGGGGDSFQFSYYDGPIEELINAHETRKIALQSCPSPPCTMEQNG